MDVASGIHGRVQRPARAHVNFASRVHRGGHIVGLNRTQVDRAAGVDGRGNLPLRRKSALCGDRASGVYRYIREARTLNLNAKPVIARTTSVARGGDLKPPVLANTEARELGAPIDKSDALD